MNLILLVTKSMLPIPEDIHVIQDYGHESIIHEGAKFPYDTTDGNSMLLQSHDDTAFVKWLAPFAGVWSCTNPMVGDWSVRHIKPALVFNLADADAVVGTQCQAR